MKPAVEPPKTSDDRKGLPRWFLPGTAAALVIATAGATHKLTASLIVALLAIATAWSMVRFGARAARGGGPVGWWKPRLAIIAIWLTIMVVTAWLVG